MESEIWKDVAGYEGIYQVSNLGRVKSIDRIVLRSSTPQPLKGKIISQGTQNTGYMCVTLWNRKERKAFLVHRLVAEAFLPKQNGKDVIDHINGVRNDNRVENLRWCTQKENTNFPIARHKYNMANQKRIEHILMFHEKNSLKVVQLTKDDKVIKVWDSVKLASKELGLLTSGIYAVCVKQKKTCGGYKWKYVKDLNK